MIDAVVLGLLEHFQHHLVQRPCGGEVTPKRLFNDDAAPPSALLLAFLGQVRFAQLLRDLGKERRRRRQVEEVVASCPPLAVTLRNGRAYSPLDACTVVSMNR